MQKSLLTLAAIAALSAALTLPACGKKDAGKSVAAQAQETKDAAIDTAKDAVNDAVNDTGNSVMDKPAADPAIAAEEAARWIKANAMRDTVATRPSGLQVTINSSGPADGKSPKNGQPVRVHYEGKLVDGTVFDSSYERGAPATFPSDRLIPGWVEALSEMKPGDAWTLYIPPSLAYGEKGVTNPSTGEVIIPANAVLIFRMELLEVLGD